MKFESKFNIGDKVYLIRNKAERRFVECKACAGSGKLDGKDGIKYDCSLCHGRCGNYEYGNIKWVVEIHNLTIGKIDISFTCSTGIEGMIGNNYKSQKEYKERYMCEETGIGNGAVYDFEYLFKSEEDAQEECDRRNEAIESE